MTWFKPEGSGQNGYMNIIDLVYFQDKWYGLFANRVSSVSGTIFDVGFYLIVDIQYPVYRTQIGSSFYYTGEYQPTMPMAWQGVFQGGNSLIEFDGAIYFALCNRLTAETSELRIYKYDGESLTVAHTVDSPNTRPIWPNDMCVADGSLFIASEHYVTRYDPDLGWSSLTPYEISEYDLANGARANYVSICGHDGKVYVSAEIINLDAPDWRDDFKLMYSFTNGATWVTVTTWQTGTYGEEYCDDTFTSLTSFNGSLYMLMDVEYSYNNKIYKLTEGAPTLVAEHASSTEYRHFGKLFTTSIDSDTRMYIGGSNAIRSINTSDYISTELVLNPTPSYPLLFMSAAVELGSRIFWVANRNLFQMSRSIYQTGYEYQYATIAYYKEPSYVILNPSPITYDSIWFHMDGAPQAGQLNIDSLAWYDNHWYMLTTDYVHKESGGSNFQYMFYEVHDLQSMSRTVRGGPWPLTRSPSSSQWIYGNFRNGRKLIVYHDKIYFATKDESVEYPRIYTLNVWCFNPQTGTCSTVYSVEVSAADDYCDLWPNDICIHNDMLFIGCCDKLIRFNGSQWSNHEPFAMNPSDRATYFGYVDYVSVCSHNSNLYVSVGTYGLGSVFGRYCDQYRIMVSTDNGDNFVDVCTWLKGTYSSTYGDQVMTSLASFNGDIYMVTDCENISNSALYKLPGGMGSPQLVVRDGSFKFRTYGHLFTTPCDEDVKMYIGSFNSVKSMDTSGQIVNEALFEPDRKLYFVDGHAINLNEGIFSYVGGEMGWDVSVDDIDAQEVYYTDAYFKMVDAPPCVENPLPIIIIIDDPLVPEWDGLGNPIKPPSLVFHLYTPAIQITIVDGSTISISITPEVPDPTLALQGISIITSSVVESECLNLSQAPYVVQAVVVDAFTHSVELTSLNVQPLEPLTQVTIRLGGEHCKALWRFESEALTVDSKGNNELTDNYNVVESSVANGFKVGSCAANFNAGIGQFFEIADSALDSGFPLKSDDTTKTFSACFWMKPNIVSVPTTASILYKYLAEANERSLNIGVYNSKVRVGWGTGESYLSYSPATTLVVDQWYFVGIAIDGVNKSLLIRIWDDTAQSVTSYSYTPTSELYVGIAPLQIGTFYTGLIDELIIFDSVLNADDFDAIRTSGIETFGDPESFGPNTFVFPSLSHFSFTTYDVIIPQLVRVEIELLNFTFALNEPRAFSPVHAPLISSFNLTIYPVAISAIYFYDIFNSANLISRWKFNSGALTTDSKGTNTLTSHGTPDTMSADYVEGNASVKLVPGSVEYYDRSNTNLSTGFPLKSGGINYGSWAIWFKARALPATAFRLIGKWYNSAGYRTLGVQYNSTGQLSVLWGYSTSFETWDPGFAVVAGEWYHFGLTFNGTTKALHGRLYRASTGTITTFSTTMVNTMTLSTLASWNIGAYAAGSYWDGQIDDVSVWNKQLSDTEIDLVRQLSAGATFSMYTAETLSTVAKPIDPDIYTIYNLITGTDLNSLQLTENEVDVIATHPFNDALDNQELLFTLGGDFHPSVEHNNSHAGGSSVKLTSTEQGKNSWISVDVEGPGVITFNWAVDSETANDILEFLIDEVSIDSTSGPFEILVWEEKKPHVSSGSHTLKWKYTKNGSSSVERSTGWLDEVTYALDNVTCITDFLSSFNLELNDVDVITVATMEVELLSTLSTLNEISVAEGCGIMEDLLSLSFTLSEVTVIAIENLTYITELLSELSELNAVDILTSSLIDLELLNIVANLNEAGVTIATTLLMNLLPLSLTKRNVVVLINGVPSSTITGLGLGMGMSLNL
jgi:hypothetical protein